MANYLLSQNHLSFIYQYLERKKMEPKNKHNENTMTIHENTRIYTNTSKLIQSNWKLFSIQICINGIWWCESSITNHENKTIPTVIFNNTLYAPTNTHTHTYTHLHTRTISIFYVFEIHFCLTIYTLYLLTIIVQQAQQQICTSNQIYTNVRKPKLWTRERKIYEMKIYSQTQMNYAMKLRMEKTVQKTSLVYRDIYWFVWRAEERRTCRIFYWVSNAN